MSGIRVTYYGHSCFGVEAGGKNLLFDPFITENKMAEHIDVSAIPADYILLSHAHFDHTKDVFAIAQRTGATIIANWEIPPGTLTSGYRARIHEYRRRNFAFPFGTVKMVYALHGSSFDDGTYSGTADSYLDTPHSRVLLGDTALHYDMKLLGKHLEIDFAFLPIGDNYTMGVDDALIASKYIKCDNIIGMHFDTVPFIRIDKDEAVRNFKTGTN
ncbi:MAG: metal-dependent hydrolase [Chitinophagales bacterium]